MSKKGVLNLENSRINIKIPTAYHRYLRLEAIEMNKTIQDTVVTMIEYYAKMHAEDSDKNTK